jgi:hypothetical protein
MSLAGWCDAHLTVLPEDAKIISDNWIFVSCQTEVCLLKVSDLSGEIKVGVDLCWEYGKVGCDSFRDMLVKKVFFN